MLSNPFNPLADMLGIGASELPGPPWSAPQMTYADRMWADLVMRCHHCWHAPRDWQQGTSHLPPPRVCCWCGANEGPQHGPYAPGGG